MDFATVKPSRKKHATSKLGGATAQRLNSAVNAQAEAIADTQLRSQYQQALQIHATGNNTSGARDLYEAILSHALLAPDRLHASADVLTQPTRNDDEVAESASASHILVQRLMLRFLTLKNRARLEEDEASAPATGEEDAAAKQQQLEHALELYLESLETGSSLARVEARVRIDRARTENGAAAAAESKSAESPSSAAAAVASGSLVEDVSLWQRAAHAALRLTNFTLARQTLERAFVLRSDLWPVIDALEDVLFASSDFAALVAVTQHALRLDPWHLKSMILQQKAWTVIGESESEPFALLDARLREQVDPAAAAAVNQHLQSLHERYQQADVREAVEQPHLVIRRWTSVQPTFGALAEQIIRLYCELTESVPLAPAFTLLLREHDGKLITTSARRIRHPLTAMVAVHLDSGKAAAAAAEPTAASSIVAAAVPPKDSDEMIDEPVADPAFTPAAASAAPVTPRTSSRVAAAPSSSTSSASALSLSAAAESDESNQLHAFLQEFACARQSSNGGWQVDASSDLPTLACALLQSLRLHPSLAVDNAALLCLITVVQANTAPVDTPSSDHLDEWLWCAEVAWEAHRLAFPSLFPPAAPAPPSAVEVLDLTNSPAPIVVPFRAPRRWFSRHLSAIALTDHYIGQLLLAQAMGHTTATVFDPSSPQFSRWERLLAQRAIARQ